MKRLSVLALVALICLGLLPVRPALALDPTPTLEYTGPVTTTLDYTPGPTPAPMITNTNIVSMSEQFDTGLWDYETYVNIQNMGTVWITTLAEYNIFSIVFGFFLAVVVVRVLLAMIAQRAGGNE